MPPHPFSNYGKYSKNYQNLSNFSIRYRELYEPLIPDSLYSECVTHHDDPDVVLAIVQRLPSLNKLVLCYLIRFLQVFLPFQKIFFLLFAFYRFLLVLMSFK